jgi:pyruvoyl-dependent arginine decarboxylase (PvlArgDC)
LRLRRVDWLAQLDPGLRVAVVSATITTAVAPVAAPAVGFPRDEEARGIVLALRGCCCDRAMWW